MKTATHAGNRLGEAQEDYLKQILLISREHGGSASTQSLADRLEVKPASVTGMVKKLQSAGLVRHEPYRGARLTENGERVALEVLRHHRLLESYLQAALGYGWDEVHDEAERLEHHISESFEARIDAWLGHPTHDPHGDPIPTAELEWPEGKAPTNLVGLEVGKAGRMQRVTAQDPDSLNLLGRLGLELGASVLVTEHTSTGVRVEVEGQRYLLPVELARALWLAIEDDSQ